jgi:formate dehydrogenase major subunit
MWPLLSQIFNRTDGTGLEARSAQTRALTTKHARSDVARSVCPYCVVGCGQLVHHRDGRLISIEGDPESPISRGRLCPKGAASFALLTHPGRLSKVRYRRSGATAWEDLEPDTAMDMIADRVWDSRDRTFVEDRNGRTVMHTTAIAHIGGATLDDEENYLIKKLFTAGLGLVCLSNQARI